MPDVNSPATAASNSDKKAATDPSASGSVKETIESILVAFILAFVFRAFVVEAFVIPTGSMAPTLLGAHMRFRCEDCGYEFDVNYDTQSRGDDINIPANAVVTMEEAVRDDKGKVIRNENGEILMKQITRPHVYSIHCPNCGYKMSRNDSTGPAVHYGDRILVLKYLYLFQDPARWDVVVFKSPDQPRTYDYMQNYIKRLVGRPGESLLVLDGDVYVSKTGGEKDFEVQTKPYGVQQAMLRIVYDNDFHPQARERFEGPKWRQPWRATPGTSGWMLEGDETNGGRIFRFRNDGGASSIMFDAAANPMANHLTDWLAYDATARDEQEPSIIDTYNVIHRPEVDTPVTDLKLDLFYARETGSGPLRLKLSKYGRTFIGEISPGKARLLERKDDGTETALGERALAAAGDGGGGTSRAPMHLEFANVDYRVSLRVDGEEVLATTPAQYKPDFEQLLKNFNAGKRGPSGSAQIEAANQSCAIHHLSLWRDVYYTNGPIPPGKGAANDFPRYVVHLGPEEYFVMGDNSRISGDARYWGDPIHLPDEELEVDAGRVPGRFMLGKAFFVYWPAGYRPFTRAPGVVPNFGKMRFIH